MLLLPQPQLLADNYMETIIPLIVLAAVLYQAFTYFRAVYVRRMVMRKKVMDFLDREDASLRLKEFAVHAFCDSVSVKLPLGLMEFRKKRKKNDPSVNKAERKFHESSRKDTSSAFAKQELASIIEMMFTINLMFNKPLFWITCLTAASFKLGRKDASRDFYLDIMQHTNPR